MSLLLLTCLGAAGVHAAPSTVCPQPITVAFYDLGVLYNPKTKTGLDLDVVDALMKRIGCAYVPEFDSRIRTWTRMADHRLDMTVSGIATPEREVFADFIPYFWVRNHLVTVADERHPTSPEAFARNPALRVGVVKSYRHGAGWDEWLDTLRKQGRLEEASDTHSLVNLLRAKRIAAFPAHLAVVADLRERYGLQAEVAALPWFATSPKIDGSLVLSRTRLPVELRQTMRQEIAKMRDDGTLLAIYRKYFSEKNAREMLQGNPMPTAKPALRFAISSSWTMPFFKQEAGDQLTRGIVSDLAQAIAGGVKHPASLITLPRGRIDEAVQQGNIDVRCYSSPVWARDPDNYVWSSALFELQDVLFGHAEVSAPKSLADLPDGTTIGTVLNYRYSGLDDAFDSKRLIRENANDQEKVIKKVAANRNQYGLSNSITLAWTLRTVPDDGIAPWRIPVGSAEFRCGVVKTSHVPPEQILSAIESLKRSGKLQQILDAYR